MSSVSTARKTEDGKALATPSTPRSVEIASRGIRNDQNAGDFLSALIGDVMTEAVAPRLANTSINAMGKLLKVVEMREKFGRPEGVDKGLVLSGPVNTVEQRRQRLLEEKEALAAHNAAVEAELAGLNASGKVVV